MSSPNNANSNGVHTQVSSPIPTDSNLEEQITSINVGYEGSEANKSVDSKPPSYKKVFPEPSKLSMLTRKLTLKRKKVESTNVDPNTQTTTNNGTTQQIPPISYAEYIQSSVATTGREANASNRHLSSEDRRRKKFLKKVEKLFKHTYYLRHFIVVSACSFSLISLQVILVTNNALYSNYYSGIWLGLLNLLLILLSINTLKFAKVWLFYVSTILHVITIFINSGCTFLNIFSLAQYSNCHETNGIFYTQLGNVCSDLLKYGNLFMILIDFIVIVMLLIFTTKLSIAIRSV